MDTTALAPTDTTDSTVVVEAPVDQDVVAEDLLVEDVSIDGMCGVY